MPESSVPVQFFAGSPRLERLTALLVVFEKPGDDAPGRQVLRCRELIFRCAAVLASPSDSADAVMVVVPRAFNLFQTLADMRGRVLGERPAAAADFACCLRYTLRAKLAPQWNVVGELLLQGRDFLQVTGPVNGVRLQVNVTEEDVCLSAQACVARLPRLTLSDLGASPAALADFHEGVRDVIKERQLAGRWCHIMPRMTKGQVSTVTRHLPPAGPFASYKDLKRHWKNMYGYRLPEEEPPHYINVNFRLVGPQLFTYPPVCLRSGPPVLLARPAPRPILTALLRDLHVKVGSVCGQPLTFSGTPSYLTVQLQPAPEFQADGRPNVSSVPASHQPPPVARAVSQTVPTAAEPTADRRPVPTTQRPQGHQQQPQAQRQQAPPQRQEPPPQRQQQPAQRQQQPVQRPQQHHLPAQTQQQQQQQQRRQFEQSRACLPPAASPARLPPPPQQPPQMKIVSPAPVTSRAAHQPPATRVPNFTGPIHASTAGGVAATNPSSAAAVAPRVPSAAALPVRPAVAQAAVAPAVSGAPAPCGRPASIPRSPRPGQLASCPSSVPGTTGTGTGIGGGGAAGMPSSPRPARVVPVFKPRSAAVARPSGQSRVTPTASAGMGLKKKPTPSLSAPATAGAAAGLGKPPAPGRVTTAPAAGIKRPTGTATPATAAAGVKRPVKEKKTSSAEGRQKSAQDVPAMCRRGQLHRVSVATLSDWLQQRGRATSGRPSKAQLVSLVQDCLRGEMTIPTVTQPVHQPAAATDA